MRAVVWSDAGLADFDRALQDIARDDARAAILVADRIEAALDLLAERPIGRPGRVRETYEKRVLRTPYIIAYALSDRAITVLHIIHLRREWPDGSWPEA